mmetsp:Transcript_147806/g.275494  ORF Transcript_147806/g.275494 Transcript_147806/m.275494 type:complete len:479 (-) Transcript_147806:90-1526(-)
MPYSSQVMADSQTSRKRPKSGSDRNSKRSCLLTSRSINIPIMPKKEVAAITVPFSEAAERLSHVMDTYGIAMVTGCVDAAKLKQLEALFRDDLEQLLAMPRAQASTPDLPAHGKEVIQCAGLKKNGERCTLTSKHVGILAQKSRPLRNGSRFCAAHAPAIESSLCDLDAKPRVGPPLQLSEWPLDSLSELGTGERCSQRGLPQGKFAWACRCLDSAKRLYEILHGTGDLVIGLDNTFFVPESAPIQTKNREWPHVDQNFNCGAKFKDMDCYQSVLYIWPSTAEHASTTVVWPKSHKEVHAQMMKDAECSSRTHFVEIRSLSESLQEELLPRWRSEARRVPVPAGAVLLWNSRIVHQGWSGGPRLAQPICWEPRSRRDDAAFERKLRLCALGLPSTHWASLGFPHSMLGGVRLPLLRTISIAGQALALRPTLEGKPLSEGTSAHSAWTQFAEASWKKPLEKTLRSALEKCICEDIRAVL